MNSRNIYKTKYIFFGRGGGGGGGGGGGACMHVSCIYDQHVSFGAEGQVAKLSVAPPSGRLT